MDFAVVIRSLLTAKAQTGVTTDELNRLYCDLNGANIGNTRAEIESRLRNVTGIIQRNSLWFIHGKNEASHIANLVKGQKINKRRNSIATPGYKRNSTPYFRRNWDPKFHASRYEASNPTERKANIPDLRFVDVQCSRSRSPRHRRSPISRFNSGCSPSRDRSPSWGRSTRRSQTPPRNRSPVRGRSPPRNRSPVEGRSQQRNWSSNCSRSSVNDTSPMRNRSTARATNDRPTVEYGDTWWTNVNVTAPLQNAAQTNTNSLSPNYDPDYESNNTAASLPNTTEPTAQQKLKTSMQVTSTIDTFYLIGDDFLLHYALSNMKINDDRENWSMCKKAQTISEVMEIINMAPIPSGKRIIVNIGITDIINGASKATLLHSFEKLMELCSSRKLKPIIFTLVPYRICDPQNLQKVNAFNEYLMDRFGDIVLHFHGGRSDNLGGDLLKFFPKIFNKPIIAHNSILKWNDVGNEIILQRNFVF